MLGSSRSVVVLAEDNRELRALMASGLEVVGFTVVQAENGADLVEKARELATGADRALDLALIATDVRMPVLDGISAVRQLREHGITVPVIFMSAYGDETVRGAIDSLNARWIDKPIGVFELRAVVIDMLGAR